MKGEIAQIVALTCYGNAFLYGQADNRFFPSNSTCQFCERVTFVTLGRNIFGKVRATEIASTPDAWFNFLKSRGALGIRLFRTPQNEQGFPDRLLSGLAGSGGTWKMEVLFPRRVSEFWTAKWNVGNQEAPNQKIWRVTYGRVSQAKTRPSTVHDLAKAAQELAGSLKDTRAFSAKQKIDWSTKCFDEALDTIATKGRNRHGYHQDLAPNGFLSDEAAMLLDACQKSWVFGGMGSWNDMAFNGEDQHTYERVSEHLFQEVNASIEAAVSSTLKKGLAAELQT